MITMFHYAWKEIKKRRSKWTLNILATTSLVVLLITLNSLSLAYKDASGLAIKPSENLRSP